MNRYQVSFYAEQVREIEAETIAQVKEKVRLLNQLGRLCPDPEFLFHSFKAIKKVGVVEE